MVVKKPDYIIKDWAKKQVYLFIKEGLPAQVAIPLRSGKTLLCSVVSLEPLYKARIDNKRVTSIINGKSVYVAVVKPERYL